jgi:hypothetical protein
MPRIARAAPGGYVYHALNRAVARLPLFEKEADFAALKREKGPSLFLQPLFNPFAGATINAG